MLNGVFRFIEYYLPVFIPIFLTILSVLSGILTGRIEKNYGSVLKIHNDIVLGLFSFIIWALVTYQQTGLIKLNNEYSISFIRVIILLFMNFIAVIIGLILVKHKWHDSKYPIDLRREETLEVKHKGIKGQTKENTLNGAFLLCTIILVFLPLALKVDTIASEDNKAKSGYRVTIPYNDESIARQVGASRWNGRLLCEVYDIKAANKKDAITQALLTFDQSGKNIQIFRHKSEEVKKVIIKNDYILCAQAE